MTLSFLTGRSANQSLTPFQLGFFDISAAFGQPAGTNYVHSFALTDSTGTAIASGNPLPVAFSGALSLGAGAAIIGAVSQSGTWTTGRTWNLSSGSDSVLSAQFGTWTVGISNFPATQAISAASLPLPANAAVETGGNLAATAAALGTTADAAWSGTGNGSVVAALKAIWAAVKGTLTVKDVNSAPSQSPTLITPSDTAPFTPPTLGISLIVTTPGVVKLGFANGTTMLYSVLANGYYGIGDLAPNQVFVTGSTAVFTAYAKN